MNSLMQKKKTSPRNFTEVHRNHLFVFFCFFLCYSVVNEGVLSSLCVSAVKKPELDGKHAMYFFLFLLGWMTACGCSDPASPGFGTITGEARLEGEPDARTMWIRVVSARGDTVTTLHPDSAGRYEVSDLPPGIYAIRAEQYGYIPLDDVDVEVKGGTIHPFDILLKKAEPAFCIDTWSLQVFYARLGIFVANSVRLDFRYHFEGLDGGIRNLQVLGAGLEADPFFRLSPVGMQDALYVESFVEVDSTKVWPVGTPVVVDTYIRGSYFVERNFDATGAIPFEISRTDTVIVELGKIITADDAGG